MFCVEDSDGTHGRLLRLVYMVNPFVWNILLLSMWWLSIYLWLLVYCNDVGVEPVLQLLDCEPLQYTTAHREDGALP